MSNIGKLSIRVYPDTSHFKSETKAQLDALQGQLKFNAEVHASVSQASISETQARLAAIGRDAKAHLTVDAQTREASAALGVLARPRTAEIRVALQGMDAARAGLASLTGGNIAGAALGHSKELASNFDRVAVSAGLSATRSAMMGAALSASVGSAAQIGVSLVQIAGAGLALPGLAAGFAVGIASSMDGLQNIHLAIDEIVGKAGYLQDAFVGMRFDHNKEFWKTAKVGLTDLVETGVKPFMAEYVKLGAVTGQFWSEFFAGLSRGIVAVGGMSQMFQPLHQAFETASQGAAPFAEAMVRLGAVGGEYLPQMAQGFTNVSNAFLSWVTEAQATGQINALIDQGIANIKALGSILLNVVGIMAAVANAAQNAGGGGLQTMAGALGQINAALSGPLLQGALTSIFTGAFGAMHALEPAVKALSDAFVVLAPTISDAMVKAGTAVSDVVQGIAQALQDPAISTGITQLFDGIVQAAKLLAPAFAAAAPSIGALMGAVGEMLPIIANLVSQVVQGLSPAFAEFKGSLGGVAQALGAGLSEALKIVLPVISNIISKVAEFMAQNPQVVASILAVLGAIGPLTPIIGTVVSVVGTIISVVSSAMSTFGAWGAVLNVLGVSMGGVLAPAGLIVGIVGLIVAAFVNLVATSEPFRAMLISIGQNLVALGASIISAVLPGLQAMVSGFMSAVSTIIAALQPFIVAVVGLAAQVIGALTPIIQWVLSKLAPVFTEMGKIVGDTFQTIAGVIGGAVGVITGIINALSAALRGDWGAMWAYLNQAVAVAWATITNLVNTGIQAVRAVIVGVVSVISSVWSGLWDTVKNLASSAWSGITGAVSNGVGTVANVVKSLPGRILGAIGNLGHLLRDSGAAMIRGLADGIRNGIGAAVNAAKGVVGEVRKFFPFSPAKKGPFSGRGYTTYSGRALVGDFARSIAAGRDQVADATSYALSGADFTATAGFEMVGTPAPATIEAQAQGATTRDDEVAALLAQLAGTLGRLQAVDSRAFLQMKREAERVM